MDLNLSRLTKKGTANRRWILVLSLLILAFALTTRPQPNVVGKNFSAVDYYKPPNDAQMKSLVQGSKAERQPDGRLLRVSELKLQSFSELNVRQILVEAPECFYDEREHTANSSGPLRAQSGKGEVSLEGEGFLWRQTNSSLIISNRVHTIINTALMDSSNRAPAGITMSQITNLEIFSDQFTYSAESGLGIYSGNVRVAGTNLSLTSGQLTIVLPLEERQLQSITAEQDVTVQYEGIQAKGDRVRYEAASGQVRIAGAPGRQPSWSAGDRQGNADDLLIDPTNRFFRAEGHAALKMVTRGQSGGGFLPGKKAPGPKGGDQIVDITCASYEVKTNSAIFRQDVEVRQSTPGSASGTLHCQLLTALFAGTNELQQIIAETNVVMELETNRFSADRALYTAKDDLLELNGTPKWSSGPREGSGDHITVHPTTEEMHVTGNAIMRLPAEEIAGSGPGGLVRRANTNSVTAAGSQLSQITCQEYVLKPETAVFQGDVHVQHPEMNWQCETITAQLSSEAKNGRVVAEKNVVFDLTQDQVHGTGNRAVFTFGSAGGSTNSILELTGNPVLTTTNGIFQNQVIVMDLTKKRMVAPGRFRIQGNENAPPLDLRK